MSMPLIAIREPSMVHRNYRKSEAHKHTEVGKYFYITLPKLPFPMARNIWKWSKFTTKGREEQKRERRRIMCYYEIVVLFYLKYNNITLEIRMCCENAKKEEYPQIKLLY